MGRPEVVRNWHYLEREITLALQLQGFEIKKNADRDPFVGEVNIAKLAQALSRMGVLVEVTVVSARPST